MRLTLPEAARLIGVTDRTLRRWIQAGDLSAYREVRRNREVWTVDTADVVRTGEARGFKWTRPDDSPGPSEIHISDSLVSDSALTDTHGQTPCRACTAWQTMVEELRGQLEVARTRETWLQMELVEARLERQRLLPPVREERKVSSWWRRLVRSGERA